MAITRLLEKIDLSECSSDGMRLDAWRVALSGTRDNLFLPAHEPYSVYYANSAIGIHTRQVCAQTFVTVHNFYLEQLYIGGVFWLIFLLAILYKIFMLKPFSILGIGLLSFSVFLFFAPTYPHFYPLLLSFLFLIYTRGVDYYKPIF